MISALSRRNDRQQTFGTGCTHRIVIVADTRVRNVRSDRSVEVAGGAVCALARRVHEMSGNSLTPRSFGRPTLYERSTLVKVFRRSPRTGAGTGRHPGPLYEVTALGLALAAWFAAQVGELHALA